jgi:hypothetical protein
MLDVETDVDTALHDSSSHLAASTTLRMAASEVSA